MSFGTDALIKTCNGKSQSRGGLNIPEIKQVLESHGIKPAESRLALNQQICELLKHLRSSGSSSMRMQPVEQLKPVQQTQLKQQKQQTEFTVQEHTALQRESIEQLIERVIAHPETAPQICNALYKKYTTEHNRQLKYDTYFLACIATILGFRDPIYFGKKPINTNTFDPKGEIKPENRMVFFLEDIYTVDTETLYAEHKILEQTGQCTLFRSNIVNLAMMQMCYATRCFDKYFGQHKHRTYSGNWDQMAEGYESIRKQLLDATVTAYTDQRYISLHKLYDLYMRFYRSYVRGSLDYFEFGANRDVDYGINPNYYMYLSCNIQGEIPMARLLPTKFAVSHIGFRPAHDDLYDTMMVIKHDFIFHGAIRRIIKMSADSRIRWQQFYVDLAKTDATTQRVTSNIHWGLQNEIAYEVPLSLFDMVTMAIGTAHNMSVWKLYDLSHHTGIFEIDYNALEQSKNTVGEWVLFVTFLLNYCQDILVQHPVTLALAENFVANPPSDRV